MSGVAFSLEREDAHHYAVSFRDGDTCASFVLHRNALRMLRLVLGSASELAVDDPPAECQLRGQATITKG